jgi:hypothetical protein
MNGLLIVFAAAFLLLLLQLDNVGAAGPYDGEWIGTATSTGQRCKQAVVKFTVQGRNVSGQARFEHDAPKINGTVATDGAAGATIGFQPLWGQFTGNARNWSRGCRASRWTFSASEAAHSHDSD